MILPDIIDSEERCVRIKGYQPFNHSTCGRFYKLSLSVPVIFVGFLMSNVSEQQMFEHLQEWKGELGFVVQKRDKLSLSPCPNVILFRYQWSYLYVGCFSPQIVYPTVLVEGRQRNHSYDSVRHRNTFVRLGYCVVWWHGNNSEEDKDRFEDRTYREHASTAGFVTRRYRPVWTRTFGIHRVSFEVTEYAVLS